MAVAPDRSLGFTLTVVIAGLGIVLATLALLIIVFSLFGRAVYSAQKKADEKKNKERIENSINEIKNIVPLPPPPAKDDEISPEIVAAISAAVYMLEGDGAKISSIRRKGESRANVWANAAAVENAKPFRR